MFLFTDVAPISDIIKVNNENEFVRTIYAGNAIATVKSSDSPIVASVRGTSFPPCELTGSASTENGMSSLHLMIIRASLVIIGLHTYKLLSDFAKIALKLH